MTAFRAIQTGNGQSSESGTPDGNARHGTPRVIAAFDIGSNSIKMTVGRAVPGDLPMFEEVLQRSEVVRLGEHVDETGVLAEDRMQVGLDTISRFAAEARKLGADRLIGVATEATRVAKNGRSFLDAVQAASGLQILQITGDAEAHLTFAGLDASVDRAGSIVVADIGGASTELINATDGNIESVTSVPVGSLRLTDKFAAHDPPLPNELASSQNYATELISDRTLPTQIDRLAITGGTGFYLERLLDPSEPHDRASLIAALAIVTRLPAAELASLIDAPVARARVLPGGLAIVMALVELTKPQEVVFAQSGIRNGLLLSAFGESVTGQEQS